MTHVYIIAEIGNNHEGDEASALQHVTLACETGVDAVKLPYIRADTLVHKNTPSPAHAMTDKTTYERLKSMELPMGVYEEAHAICQDAGVEFIVTVTDLASVAKLADGIADKLKIASGDLTYKPILEAAAFSGIDVILSTGMAGEREIFNAMYSVTPEYLLHCVSLYPCPPDAANLGRINYLRRKFGDITYIGYSDHCVGEIACVAAAALGAKCIEKHFTLTPEALHVDHPHSLDPPAMAEMVAKVRAIGPYLYGKPDADEPSKEWLRRKEDGLR